MRCITIFLTLIFQVFSIATIQAKEKIALLFLTVNDLNHPKIWKEEIIKNSQNFNVYIHSKNLMADPFFSLFRIKNIVPTSWGFHVYAWQELVKEAYKDPENKKFIFLSESCIPLRPLKEIYKKLIKDDYAYIMYSRPWWPDNHGREVVELPKEHRWGNDEWIILTRVQAQYVAKDSCVIRNVARHGSDAESYFSSLLSYNGQLDDPNIINRKSTYSNWELADGPHPYTFKDKNNFNLNLLQFARLQGYFFARKVSNTFPDEAIANFINYGNY